MSNKSSKSVVFPIYYTAFWDRFNLYGLQSIIVLYSISVFGLIDKSSYALYSCYIALSYTFTVIGGLIADRLLGYFYASVFGSVLIICANLIFCLNNINLFKIGLGFMIVGIGLLKPNNANLLGMIHREDSLTRNKAFSFFYTAINLGSFIGPLLYGLSFTHHLAHFVFIASAIGTATALMSLRHLPHASLVIKQKWILVKTVITIITCLLVNWLFIFYYNLYGYFLALVTTIGLVLSIKSIKKLTGNDRKTICSLFGPILSCIFFMMALFQVYSSLTLFFQRCVDRHIFGWIFPASWFGLLEPLFLFLMVPILNYVWKKLAQKNMHVAIENKVIFGSFACCIAFLLFALSSQLITSFGNYLLFPLLILANIFLAIAELLTIPVTMSLISLIGSAKYRSTIMGIFYFSFTFSGYLSGMLTKLQPNNNANTAQNYTPLFLDIALILLAVTLLIFVFNYTIKRNELKRIANVVEI